VAKPAPAALFSFRCFSGILSRGSQRRATLAADGFGWGEARARDWIRDRVEAAILHA